MRLKIREFHRELRADSYFIRQRDDQEPVDTIALRGTPLESEVVLA
jgi:hypothetical protein